MRLSMTKKVYTRYTAEQTLGNEVSKQLEDARNQLPSYDIVKRAGVLVLEYADYYYVTKSRHYLVGDPCPELDVEPVDPYELEFECYTKSELSELVQSGNLDSVTGENILVRMTKKIRTSKCEVYKDGDLVCTLDYSNSIEEVVDYIEDKYALKYLTYERLDNHHFVIYSDAQDVEFHVYYTL